MDRPTIVFPRTSVAITQEGEDTVVADANVTVLYRGEQEYSRGVLDPVGDRCDWFEIDSEWISDIARAVVPAPYRCTDSPIRHTHAPTPSRTYLMQRMLVRHLTGETHPDQIMVEETVMGLFESTIRSAYAANDQAPDVRKRHRDLVEDCKAYLGTNFTRHVSLADVGRAVGASPFHLARMFRALTGYTIHRYLTNLRLRAALTELEDDGCNIADIALGLGFASHSHLSKVFRGRFGITPSMFRERKNFARLL